MHAVSIIQAIHNLGVPTSLLLSGGVATANASGPSAKHAPLRRVLDMSVSFVFIVLCLPARFFFFTKDYKKIYIYVNIVLSELSVCSMPLVV